jgi:N-acetylmuramoyl-L-alanine amidase
VNRTFKSPYSKFLFIALLAGAFTQTTSASHSGNFRILLDPGHGGSDSGAVRGKAREADIALSVARLLKQDLIKGGELTVQLTRDSDTAISLQERVRQAEEHQVDLMISIHANASDDSKAKGVEFYFQNQLAPDEDSLFLASIENSNPQLAEGANSKLYAKVNSNIDDSPSKSNDVLSIVEDLKRQRRMFASHKLSRFLLRAWDPGRTLRSNTIRQAPFFVVAKAPVPSVLIELGFVSNPKESQKLTDPQYQGEIAGRIADGIRQYKELIDKVPATPIE